MSERGCALGVTSSGVFLVCGDGELAWGGYFWAGPGDSALVWIFDRCLGTVF